MATPTILVAEDTPAQRVGLQQLLKSWGFDADVAADGEEALQKVVMRPPTIVLSDMVMPRMGGLDLLKSIKQHDPSVTVVILTAQASVETAVEAIKDGAYDYLMKPVDDDKLADTLDRVKTRLAEKRGLEEVEKLKNVLAEVAPEALPEMEEDGEPATGRFEKLINIKDQGQIFRVDVDTIELIEAAGDYMVIKTAANTLILRETMKDLEKRLDPRRFQRVHRSTIVNLDLVKQVKPHTNGECFLVLDSGASVKVSRSYRDVVARFVH